jgi:hypothetical protein
LVTRLNPFNKIDIIGLADIIRNYVIAGMIAVFILISRMKIISRTAPRQGSVFCLTIYQLNIATL